MCCEMRRELLSIKLAHRHRHPQRLIPRAHSSSCLGTLQWGTIFTSSDAQRMIDSARSVFCGVEWWLNAKAF